MHVLWDCPVTTEIRHRLAMGNLELLADKATALAGCDDQAISFILLKLNQFLTRLNYHEETPSLSGFTGFIRSQEKTEWVIALTNGKTSKHNRKWQRIKPLLNIN